MSFWNHSFHRSGWKWKIPKSCTRKRHFLNRLLSRSGGWSWRGVVWVLPDTCNKLQNYATKSKRRLCNSRRSPWFGTTTAQAQRDGSCEDLHGLVSVGFFEMERCLGHMQRINDWILELVWHTNQKDIWQTSENNRTYVYWIHDGSSGDHIVPRCSSPSAPSMDKVGPMAPYGAYGYLEPRFKNTINGDSSRLETKANLDLKPPTIELWLYKHLESWSDERTWRALFKVKLSATLHACFKFSAAWLGR